MRYRYKQAGCSCLSCVCRRTKTRLNGRKRVDKQQMCVGVTGGWYLWKPGRRASAVTASEMKVKMKMKMKMEEMVRS